MKAAIHRQCCGSFLCIREALSVREHEAQKHHRRVYADCADGEAQVPSAFMEEAS